MQTNIDHLKPTIIIVDDDPAICNSLKFSLGIEGYLVREYSSAPELLEETTFPEKGCLVIDYRLPCIDGLELLSKLRRRDITLPAILITTRPSGRVRVLAARAGIPLIEKPLLTEDLFQCIRAALAGDASSNGAVDQNQ
jgi:two-component system, LuxR family, response regulator FixJ